MDDILTPTEKMARALKNASARAEAAEAAETSLRHEWRDYTRAKVQEFADMQRELNSARAETERLRKHVAALGVTANEWQNIAMKAENEVVAVRAEYHRRWQDEHTEAERLRQKVATLRHAFQFVMNVTGNRFSITSLNVATAALDATAN